MTTDRHAISLAALLRRVEEVANASPSLEALYALEPNFEYNHFWHPAYKLLLQCCEAQRSQDAWRAELRRPPPDLVIWLSLHRRRNVTPAGIQDAAQRWRSMGSERMLAFHHAASGVLEGVAAVHLALLADLDPIGAVEYVSALPSEHLVWPAVYRIELHKRQELIDRVLAESHSRDAVLLCVACILDEQSAHVRGLVNDRRQNNHDGGAGPAVNDVPENAWTSIAHRHRQLAIALMQRHDAGAVLGPWIRHLVRCVDHPIDFDQEQRPSIAMVALGQVLSALPDGSALELERASEPNAACLVARMLVNARTDRGNTDWEEWQSLLLAEHDSLHFCASVGWQAAAKALLRADDPHAAWVQVARSLQPILRRRARHHSSDVDPVIHLVMPGLYASAFLGVEGAALWLSVFEFARRQFLVDQPPGNDPKYRLCSDAFTVFRWIFRTADALDRALALLPTPAHVGWAREQLGESPQP